MRIDQDNRIANGRYGFKFSFDESYFEEIDTPEKAYWVGFIIADGNIYKNRLKIKLCQKDINHLRSFREHLKSTHDIATWEKDNTCCITLTSNKVCKDLEKFNIVPNKTKIIKFPHGILSDLQSHLIRGIFDGDGSWTTDRSGSSCSPKFKIASANEEFLDCINSILIENKIISKTKRNIYKHKNHWGSCFVLEFGGSKQCKRIYNFLYKDAEILLQRKKDQVKTLIENYNKDFSLVE